MPLPTIGDWKMKKNKILIVDDESTSLTALQKILDPEGYEISVATDGENALDLVVANPPDLILLDIVMPGMDGHEVCRRVKADPDTKDIPIIFVTIMGDEEEEFVGLDLGAADYIRKPFAPVVIRARVKTQLRLQQAYAELKERDDRRTEELKRAKDTQDHFYPSPAELQKTEDQGFRIFTYSRSASEINGDLINLQHFDDSGFALTIADCQGHGVSAALMTMTMHAFLRNVCRNEIDAANVQRNLSRMLKGVVPEGEIVAAVNLCVTKTDLSISSSAFPPPLIYQKNTGEIWSLGEGNLPLCCQDSQVFNQVNFKLKRGDKILITSDGVVESRRLDGETYGSV